VIPKSTTLNDPDWPFYAKLWFRVGVSSTCSVCCGYRNPPHQFKWRRTSSSCSKNV